MKIWLTEFFPYFNEVSESSTFTYKKEGKPVAFQGKVLSKERMFWVLALSKQFLGSSAQTLLQIKRVLMQQYNLSKQSEWPTDWRKSQSKQTFFSVGGGEAWGLWLNDSNIWGKQFLSYFSMKGSKELCGLRTDRATIWECNEQVMAQGQDCGMNSEVLSGSRDWDTTERPVSAPSSASVQDLCWHNCNPIESQNICLLKNPMLLFLALLWLLTSVLE